MHTVTLMTILGAALLLGGCNHQRPGDDLYRQLGGQPGLERIADAFIDELAGDRRVVDSFAETDIAQFRTLLIEQLCELSGGPCRYSGRSMAEAHAGMNVSAAQFDALVEDLMAALDSAGIAQGAQNRLLGLLAPYHGEVVSG